MQKPQFNRFEDLVKHIKGKSFVEVLNLVVQENATLQQFCDLPRREKRAHPELLKYDDMIGKLHMFLHQGLYFANSTTPSERELLEQVREELKSRGQWTPLSLQGV